MYFLCLQTGAGAAAVCWTGSAYMTTMEVSNEGRRQVPVNQLCFPLAFC